MKKRTLLLITVTIAALGWSCTSKQEKTENRMREFISRYEAKVVPLYREAGMASWNAEVSGTDENWAKSEKASFELEKVFSDAGAFAELKEIKESGLVKDSLLARQLDILYNAYLEGQVDTALTARRISMETAISKKYSNFRANIDGKEVSDNEIDRILQT